MSPLAILALALCWLVIPATPFVLIWLAANRKARLQHLQARSGPDQSHSLAGGDEVISNHFGSDQ
jgi:hypothetical protein